MNFKPFLLLAALSSASTLSAALSFSLQFSNAFGDGVLSGIADETGSTASGLAWGILIAESGSDFSIPLTTDIGISTADGSSLADGLVFFNGGLTTALPFGTDPGVGVVSATGTISADDFSPPIDTGDSFALIWFERGFSAGDTLVEGDNYGLLTNSNFIVPANGSSLTPLGSNFNGPDPVRSASLVVQAIPEPSSLLLVSLASVVLVRRRRS